MASLSKATNGTFAVHVTKRNGKRTTVRLGKIGKTRANTIHGHIHELEQARRRGIQVVAETREWLEKQDGDLRARLAAAGLCSAHQLPQELGEFVAAYLKTRTDVTDGTMEVFRQAETQLVAYLGKDTSLLDVTEGDAEGFRTMLRGKGRADATIAKMCQYARHFFEVAKRHRMIPGNPFAAMKGITVKSNSARHQFVPARTVLAVMDQASDPQWKLLIALARWGGLRVPSEALRLTWGDVDFANLRFTVRSTKTKRSQKKGVRLVPMFPELVELFQRIFDEAPEGSTHVITRYRSHRANLRTQLQRYIKAAGFEPWEKPWQNMRATRATELADKFPPHVCDEWLGHSEKIANEHYRQVRPEHYQKAAANDVKSDVAPQCTTRNGGTFPREKRNEMHSAAGDAKQQGIKDSNLN